MRTDNIGGGKQDISFFVILVHVGIHHIAGIGVSDHVAVHIALLIVSVHLLFYGLPVQGFDDLIVHLNVVILLVGTDEADMNVTVFRLGFNPHRIIGIVAESVVDGTPVDGSVHAQRHIVDREHVLNAIYHFQVGMKRAVI